MKHKPFKESDKMDEISAKSDTGSKVKGPEESHPHTEEPIAEKDEEKKAEDELRQRVKKH